MYQKLKDNILKLELPANALCVDADGNDLRTVAEKSVTINKVAVLIGKNGSGKSLMLESHLKKHMEGIDSHDFNVVSFSSGQNEKYSQIMRPYLENDRKSGNSLNLNCFHFDKSWSKLLIFLALANKPDGLVREFGKENGYVIESKEDKSDISTELKFQLKVDEKYRVAVHEEMKKTDSAVANSLISTPFHRALEDIIKQIIDPTYGFETPISDREVLLTAKKLSKILPVQLSAYASRGKQQIDARVNMFTQVSADNQFIDRSKVKLYLNGIEMDKLSDGEFQILCILALIDLFDSENTLFLIDEADSHLHWENIKKLWKIFFTIKGYILTATHQIDSISATKAIENLKLVEEGRIKENLLNEEIVSPDSVIFRTPKFEFDLYAKLENIVIMDNTNDWKIVTMLAEKLAKEKGLDISLLSSITAISKPSNCEGRGSPVGVAKFKLVEDMKNYWKENNVQYNTKRIFMISDRDNGDFDWEKDGVQLLKDGVKLPNFRVKDLLGELRKKWPGEKAIVNFMVWQHREIENYLLSYSAMEGCKELEEINNELAEKYQLKPGKSCDNKQAMDLDVKNQIRNIIGIKDSEFDEQKVRNHINKMHVDEISKDIENMLMFIFGVLKNDPTRAS